MYKMSTKMYIFPEYVYKNANTIHIKTQPIGTKTTREMIPIGIKTANTTHIGQTEISRSGINGQNIAQISKNFPIGNKNPMTHKRSLNPHTDSLISIVAMHNKTN